MSSTSDSVLVKRKFDAEEEDKGVVKKKYTGHVECQVCFNTLGEDKGFVPCVLSRCRPVAHLICFNCANGMADKQSGLIKCPKCRVDGELLVIPALVDEETDSWAKETIDKIRFTRKADEIVEKQNLIINLSSSAALQGRMDIIEKRVAFIVERESKFISSPSATLAKYPQGRYVHWSSIVPDFDSKNVRLKCNVVSGTFPRKTNKITIRDSLKAVVMELKSVLRKVYEGKTIQVTIDENDQEVKNYFVYLKVHVKFIDVNTHFQMSAI